MRPSRFQIKMPPHILGNGRLRYQLVDQSHSCILPYVSRRSVVGLHMTYQCVSGVIAIEIGLDVWNRRDWHYES
jgi:hypothetical protein